MKVRCWLCLCLLAACASAAPAADLPWKQAKKYMVVAERKDLRELLREFAASYGLSVVVDESVNGNVTGRFELTPQSMLEYLASTFSFVWFYDGNVLYLNPSDSMVSEIIPMPAQSAQRSLRTLDRLGLVDRRFGVNYDAGARVARVAGPKQYVELIRNALRSIDADSMAADEAVVRVVRLRYAFAADQSIDGSEGSVVPGVATVLAQLFPAITPARGRGGPGSSQRMQRVPVKGTNVSLPDVPTATEVVQDAIGGVGGTRSNNALPQFRADARLNAILIRDLPHRIGQYEDVVRGLDVKPLVIEIEARILEVSSDMLESLGLDWRLRTGRIDIQSGRGPLSPSFGGGPPDSLPQAGALSGFVASTLLVDAGRSLLARVNALAQAGKAVITARPKVLTLDNIEATIDDSRQFYVRVASERDAGLYQVTSGTLMRVRPMVVQEKEGRQVKLAIRIEDGAPTSAQVDAIPIVRRTSIGTWAFVNEGESLLVGGFATESSSNGETGVPVLSKLPILGALFRFREQQQANVERLFLLTPRIVER
jgi:type III secretion protein C